MELHTLLRPNYDLGVQMRAYCGLDDCLGTLESRVRSESPPWSQAGAQRMGPGLHLDLPKSHGSSNKDIVVWLTLFVP
jgi:hypothetical protein